MVGPVPVLLAGAVQAHQAQLAGASGQGVQVFLRQSAGVVGVEDALPVLGDMVDQAVFLPGVGGPQGVTV